VKLYLSVDMEGITGAQAWSQTELGGQGYAELRQRMALETATVAAAALKAGAQEIWVQDAHDTGRNLEPGELPEGCRLLRGWSGDPRLMVQELDSTFDGLLLVGWHAAAGSGASPLCHSMSTRLTGLRLNGESCSELRLAALSAAGMGVPLLFCAGDAATVAEAALLAPGLGRVCTQEGRGDAVLCQDAAGVLRQLEEECARALRAPRRVRLPKLPRRWELELDYREGSAARRASFYPGMEQVSPLTLRLKGANLEELLRALLFVA
jgi:D-amino peptidase